MLTRVLAAGQWLYAQQLRPDPARVQAAECAGETVPPLRQACSLALLGSPPPLLHVQWACDAFHLRLPQLVSAVSCQQQRLLPQSFPLAQLNEVELYPSLMMAPQATKAQLCQAVALGQTVCHIHSVRAAPARRRSVQAPQLLARPQQVRAIPIMATPRFPRKLKAITVRHPLQQHHVVQQALLVWQRPLACAQKARALAWLLQRQLCCPSTRKLRHRQSQSNDVAQLLIP